MRLVRFILPLYSIMLSKYVFNSFIWSVLKILMLFVITDDLSDCTEVKIICTYASTLRSCRVRAQAILNYSLLSTMLLVCGDVRKNAPWWEKTYTTVQHQCLFANELWILITIANKENRRKRKKTESHGKTIVLWCWNAENADKAKRSIQVQQKFR